MLITISPGEYAAILSSPLRSNAILHKQYAAGVHSLISRWAAKLTPHQLAVILFVFDRTFYHAKVSETVVFDQFMHGMGRTNADEMVFCGLKISMPTLLKTLKQLADDDFLHVRACESRDGKSETKPRLYAINCKKLFNLDIVDERNPMILREPKQKRVVESDDFSSEEEPKSARNLLKTPRKVGATPSRKPPKDFEGIYIDNTDTKVSSIGGASLAEPPQKVDAIAAMEALRAQRLAARRSTTSGMRALKSLSRNPYSKVNVQKIVDDAMQSYHPALPRVIVADKPLGVLKKRMATAGVDLTEFVNWAIQFWRTTASAHERSARKRVGEVSKYAYQPMPEAPEFATLCYRFPYFLACYRSYLQAEAHGLAVSREEQLERQNEKLQRQVEAARQDARGAREREINLRRRAAPARPAQRPETPQNTAIARVRRAPAAPTPVDLHDDDIPEWDDHPVQKVRK